MNNENKMSKLDIIENKYQTKPWIFAAITIFAYFMLSFIAPLLYQVILMIFYAATHGGDLGLEDGAALMFYNSFTHIITYTVLTPVIIILSIFALKQDVIKFKNRNKLITGVVSTAAAPIVMFISMYVISIIMLLLGLSDTSDNQEALNNVLFGPYKIGIIVTVVLMAPVIEELVFRKSIHTCIMPNTKSIESRIIRVLVSGICFGMLHVISPIIQYISIGEFVNALRALLQVFPYLVMGFVFGALYEVNDGNVIPGIIVHAAWNTISVISTYISFLS